VNPNKTEFLHKGVNSRLENLCNHGTRRIEFDFYGIAASPPSSGIAGVPFDFVGSKTAKGKGLHQFIETDFVFA